MGQGYTWECSYFLHSAFSLSHYLVLNSVAKKEKRLMIQFCFFYYFIVCIKQQPEVSTPCDTMLYRAQRPRLFIVQQIHTAAYVTEHRCISPALRTALSLQQKCKLFIGLALPRLTVKCCVHAIQLLFNSRKLVKEFPFFPGQKSRCVVIITFQ